MIKKLLLSSLILILSWNVFSQNVTEIKDTTHIILSTRVARQVAVDLIEGDEAKAEVDLLAEEIQKMKSLISLQDSLGNFKENQIAELNKVIQLQQVQTQEIHEETDRLNRELRKQMNLKTVFEVSTGIAVVALLVSIVVGGK